MEKQRTLVRRDAVDELIDRIAGTVLTCLSGMSARCSRDVLVRRNIDAVVRQVRTEISEACTKWLMRAVNRRSISRADEVAHVQRSGVGIAPRGRDPCSG